VAAVLAAAIVLKIVKAIEADDPMESRRRLLHPPFRITQQMARPVARHFLIERASNEWRIHGVARKPRICPGLVMPCRVLVLLHHVVRVVFVSICLVLLSDSTITIIRCPAFPRLGSAGRCADDHVCGRIVFPPPGTLYRLLKCDVFIPYGMEIMLSIDRREPCWLAGAVCLAVSGIAWAGGVADDTYSNLVIASIAPTMPIEVVPPIPEPSQYIFHYAMQFSSFRGAAEAFNPSDFYAAPMTANGPFKQRPTLSFQGGQQGLKLQTQTQPAGHDLGAVTPTLSLIDMFQLTDDTSTDPDHPRRRLAVMVNDWRVSASAHLPLDHPHDAGASVNLQHKF
jgi:hypothetical protein